jgi:dTDP-4-amino-4,6-dideoxygalactose transaminase
VLTLRRQLPVFSPVRFSSLLTGALGALGAGRPRELLEALLSEHFGADEVLLVDSGTSALRLALEAAVEAAPASLPGHDVLLLPAYCCYDIATAAVGAGARVRLYDLDPATLGPDWTSLEAGLRKGAAAVVAVHLFGVPVDIERCARLATPADALLVEDAAQGFGGYLAGRPLGGTGSLGVLSFGRGKGVTGGAGGALIANDARGRRALEGIRARSLRSTRGWSELVRLAAQWLLGRPSVYGVPAALPWFGLGATRYHRPWAPRGIGKGPAAAVVRNWRSSLEEAAKRRERVARLADLGAIDVAGALEVGACLLRLPVTPSEDRDEESIARAATEGIVRAYPKPLAALPVASSWELPPGGCPGAAYLAERLHTAPIHSRSHPERVRRALEEATDELARGPA